MHNLFISALMKCLKSFITKVNTKNFLAVNFSIMFKENIYHVKISKFSLTSFTNLRRFEACFSRKILKSSVILKLRLSNLKLNISFL